MKRMMAIIAALALLGAGGLGAAGISAKAQSSENAAAPAQEKSATFSIENMTCATCPITVRKAMMKVEGVKSVEVDFEAKTATVVFDPARTDPDEIALASTNAGYPAQAL